MHCVRYSLASASITSRSNFLITKQIEFQLNYRQLKSVNMDKSNGTGSDGNEQSIAGILSARQLLFDAYPEAKKRADENMKKFLNCREILPQAKFPFVGSDEILNGLFDVINRQVFNANFDGMKLEWCDKLRSRAVIAYEQITFSTKQTFIRCSKTWFKNRNRQHFVEAILYELIQLYIQRRGSDAGEETSPDLVSYLLAGGMSYFNIRYETNLVVNNNYKPHQDDADIDEILASIVVERTPSTGKISHFTLVPKVKLLTERVSGNADAVKCANEGGCGGFCFTNRCPAAVALRQRYYGSNIYFLFTVDRSECFLCGKAIKKGTLNAHFNKDCRAFGRLTGIVAYALAL